MNRNSTFSRKLAISFSIVVGLTVAAAGISLYATARVVAAKDHVIEVNARALVSAEQLDASLYEESSALRGYLLSDSPEFIDRIDTARTELTSTISDLQRELEDSGARATLDDLRQADLHFQDDTQHEIQLRKANEPLAQITQYMLQNAQPSRACY